MPDYIYLLESRLSPEQRATLERVQELARAQDLNVYLSGGAIRDLISGQPIRELDFTVEGNPVRIVRELEKGGARVTSEDEDLRQYDMIFAGDVDGSISGARDDVYDRPGAKPVHRFSGIAEDLRRRDFSVNAIAISLNAQSRGLLLDPTNGLADLERQELRALSIHAFTNQPVRLMSILRFAARMGCKMESRTQEWFDLAIERGLHRNINSADAGDELRAVAREENPAATLKQWETRGFLAAIHPQLQHRKPDYDSLGKLVRVRANFVAAGIRPRLQTVFINAIFGRLKSREVSAALRQIGFRSAEIDAIGRLEPEAQKIVKMLKSRKTNAPRDAYFYLASIPPEMLVFIEAEAPSSSVNSKIRAYIQKWRPLRLALPFAELDALGVPHGPKFDKIIEQIFDLQLKGKARTPEDRTKALRSLAGIKEEPKKKEEKDKKKRKGSEPAASPKADAKNRGKQAQGGGAPPAPAAAKSAADETARVSAGTAIGAKAQKKHEQAGAMRAVAKRPLPAKAKAPAKRSRGK